MATLCPVQVGQIWQDIDPRMRGRQFKVIRVDYGIRKAIVESLSTHRITEIRLDRFTDTTMGYRLVSEAPA